MSDVTSPAAHDPAVSAGGPPREIELKYTVRDDAVFRAWLESDWAAELGDVTDLATPQTAEVEDVYFDTPHRALERHGFGARLRRRGHKVTLTVKSAGRTPVTVPGGKLPSRALRRRIELEAPASIRLDPDAWPESPAKELVEELRGAARLRALFTIRQRRHERRVSSPEGIALFTLDEVEVHAGRTIVGTFTALEVESSDGREELLERHGRGAGRLRACSSPRRAPRRSIARDLVDRGGHPGTQLRAAQGAQDAWHHAPTTRSRRPAARCCGCTSPRCSSVEAGTRTGEDIEDLHKMRVATRRMRAVWRVFDGAYKPRVQRRYVRELREVATALGMVRDLDVMLEGLDRVPRGAAGGRPRGDGADARRLGAPARGAPQGAHRAARLARLPGLRGGLPGLHRDHRRGRAAAAGRDAIAGASHRGAGGSGWPTSGSARTRPRSPGRTCRRSTRCASTASGCATRSNRSGRCCPGRGRTPLIAEVVRLQDHLGLLNDADVAAGRARAWLTANASRVPPESLAAVRLYLDTHEAEVARLRKRFMPLWRRVEGPAYRRTLALALAAL